MSIINKIGWLCAAASVLAVAATSSTASVPALMNYQGKLSTSGGATVPNGVYNMRFFLWNAEFGGSMTWQEPAVGTRPVTVTGGLFNVVLGSLVPLPPAAFTGSTWLATEVNGTLLAGRVQIVSVGYALRSQVAEGLAPDSVTTNMIINGTIKGEDMQLPFRMEASSPVLQGLVEGRNGGVGIGVLGQSRGGSGLVPGVGAGVFGDSGSAPGVVGYSSTDRGVMGQNMASNNFGYLGHNSYGAYGSTGDATARGALGADIFGVKTGVYGYAADSGQAGRFDGKVLFNDEVEGTGGVGLPIASAFINSSGTKNKGSSNVTSSWNAADQRYVITIAGENYFYTNYATVVTPTDAVSAGVGSLGGSIVVEFRNASNSKVQAPFSILVFRL